MGVSAAGKSSVAAALAKMLAIPWVDADDLHPMENTAKMAAGHPLTDEDRGPWLVTVGTRLAASHDVGGVVVACSALRRAYRDLIRARAPETVFIHLTGPHQLLAERAQRRTGHFMPPALLESQLAALEPLDSDETGTARASGGFCASTCTGRRKMGLGANDRVLGCERCIVAPHGPLMTSHRRRAGGSHTSDQESVTARERWSATHGLN
nr:gluconokinase [Microbacterium sorbitolivorans]